MYYNPHFTEYDIVSDEIEARLYFKGYGFDSNLFYSYSASNNILDNINSELTNFDRSYREHRYGFSTKRKIKKLSYIDNLGISLIIRNRMHEMDYQEYCYDEQDLILLTCDQTPPHSISMTDGYSLTQLQQLSGEPVRRIRSYIQQDLLPRPKQLGRNARYSKATLTRLLAIKRLFVIFKFKFC